MAVICMKFSPANYDSPVPIYSKFHTDMQYTVSVICCLLIEGNAARSSLSTPALCTVWSLKSMSRREIQS